MAHSDVLRYLFYVEPLIERGLPFWKSGWAQRLTASMVETLGLCEQDYRVICNEPIASLADNLPVNVKITISQQEMLGCYAHGVTEILNKRLSDEIDLVGEYRFAEIIKEKLEGFVPQIIITWSPVPFMKQVAPEAIILHREYAFLSRLPYVETWSLDPYGVIGAPYLADNLATIKKQYENNQSAQQLVRDFRTICQEKVKYKSPFIQSVSDLKKRYKKTALLPLQFSPFYLFNGMTKFADNNELLLHVMSTMPDDVAVIVTSHPQGSQLENELLNYLRAKHHNLIMDREFDRYPAVSEYLAPLCDIVITVSSKVGYLPLIWENSLISLGHHFLDFISSSNKVADAHVLQACPQLTLDAALHWLLTHYAFPENFMTDRARLETFMHRAIAWKQGEFQPGELYQPMASDQAITHFYENEVGRVWSRKNKTQLVRNHNAQRPLLSVIVVLYNMRREAMRTLQSLTMKYQQIDQRGLYEVIVIDNASDQALTKNEVDQFGDYFHYHYFETSSKSPVAAINHAATIARGEHLMINIDGARILSPGVVSHSIRAMQIFEQSLVVTLGWHLGSTIQNKAILQGYCQAEEDQLLEQTNWQEDGYRLFDIACLAGSSKNGWFRSIAESNCFALSRSLFDELGGMDKQFQSPGGGLVNLDFYKRACEHDDVELVMLLGEGTFHQIHGGVATNAKPDEHPWERFHEEYKGIRGAQYQAPDKKPFYFGKLPGQAEKFMFIPDDQYDEINK